jgi:hypothetical protein
MEAGSDVKYHSNLVRLVVIHDEGGKYQTLPAGSLISELFT